MVANARGDIAPARPDQGRLLGRTAVVTGSASGIGRAIAVLFANHGANVVVNTSKRVEEAYATIREIEACGGRACFVQGDVAAEATIQALVDAAEREFGGLDVFVNNAAVVFPALVTEATQDEWDRTVDVILKAAFWSARHGIPAMQRRGGGVILSISSVNSGPCARPAWPAYVAAKGGLNALSRQLAVDYGSSGIRVNTISPASIASRMVASRNDEADALARRTDAYPLGRLGTPADVAYAALFLASDEAAFITGVDLVVDGGLTCLSPEVPVHDDARASMGRRPLAYAQRSP